MLFLGSWSPALGPVRNFLNSYPAHRLGHRLLVHEDSLIMQVTGDSRHPIGLFGTASECPDLLIEILPELLRGSLPAAFLSCRSAHLQYLDRETFNNLACEKYCSLSSPVSSVGSTVLSMLASEKAVFKATRCPFSIQRFLCAADPVRRVRQSLAPRLGSRRIVRVLL